MATVERFEDLEIWQLSRKYAASVHNLTKTNLFSREFKLIDQIKASTGSIMDNIAEGFGRGSRLEFLNFLGIAKGSLDESKSQLYRSLDYKLIDEDVFALNYAQAETICAKIVTFMNYLNQSSIKGQKFKNRK